MNLKKLKKYLIKIEEPKGNFIKNLRKFKPHVVFNNCMADMEKMVIFNQF